MNLSFARNFEFFHSNELIFLQEIFVLEKNQVFINTRVTFFTSSNSRTLSRRCALPIKCLGVISLKKEKNYQLTNSHFNPWMVVFLCKSKDCLWEEQPIISTYIKNDTVNEVEIRRSWYATFSIEEEYFFRKIWTISILLCLQFYWFLFKYFDLVCFSTIFIDIGLVKVQSYAICPWKCHWHSHQKITFLQE